MLRLNLGSGGSRLEGHVNVDSNPDENPDLVLDLGSQVWPWRDSTVDAAIASHILEHLTTEQFFHFMKELHRVLKPDAPVKIALPHPRHDIYLNDPTHQRPVTMATLLMLSKEHWATLRERGLHLTPFWRYLGVDFYIHPKTRYKLDPSIDPNDPELQWKIKHLNNVALEILVVMEARK